MKIVTKEMNTFYTFTVKVYQFVAINSQLSRYHELIESY